MALNIFFNTAGNLRSIWWVVLFFLMLTSFLFPLIILSDRYSFELSVPIQAVLLLIVSLICQGLSRRPLRDLAGRMDTVWFKELLIGAGTGAALMVLPALLLTIFGFINWQPNAIAYSTLASGLTMFLWVAVAEELLFRGFIFQRLIQAFGPWPAQLIIAGLFLLTHLNNPGMTGTIKILASVNIFVASILFGIAYLKTRKLAMPLGLHFMANFMQGTVLGFGVSGGNDPGVLKPVFVNTPVWLSGGDFGMEASVAGLFFVILITILLYFWKP